MTEPKQKRKPRSYTDEFKKQLADLYDSGKYKCDICHECDNANTLFDKWLKQAENSGFFYEKDNRTPEQQEFIELHRCNKQLEMEPEALTIMKQKISQIKQSLLLLLWIFLK